MGYRDKHDTKCAANVADLISQGKCLFYDNAPEAIVELRSLLSLRRRLKKEEHSLRMRIRNSLLAKHFPEMDRYFGQCLSENLSIVYWCMDPKKIAEMDFGRFFSTGDHPRARTCPTAPIGCAVDRASQFEAQVIVEKILQVQKEIKDTQQLIETISQQFVEYYLLLTIPGFGPYVASLVLAVIRDAWRFGSAKQVLKMAGVDLSAERSGKKSKEAVPVISKKGNAAIRYGVYQAAFIASTRNIDFVEYYTNTLRGRKRERGIRPR